MASQRQRWATAGPAEDPLDGDLSLLCHWVGVAIEFHGRLSGYRQPTPGAVIMGSAAPYLLLAGWRRTDHDHSGLRAGEVVAGGLVFAVVRVG